MIQYIKGDATQPIGEGKKIIAHICNDKGGWGRGFVVALGGRYPLAKSSYKMWAKGKDVHGNEHQTPFSWDMSTLFQLNGTTMKFSLPI